MADPGEGPGAADSRQGASANRKTTDGKTASRKMRMRQLDAAGRFHDRSTERPVILQSRMQIASILLFRPIVRPPCRPPPPPIGSCALESCIVIIKPRDRTFSRLFTARNLISVAIVVRQRQALGACVPPIRERPLGRGWVWCRLETSLRQQMGRTHGQQWYGCGVRR